MQKTIENEEIGNFPKGLKFIESCYLAFIVLAIFAFAAKAFLGFGNSIEVYEFIFNYAIYLSIYYGIKKVKSWVAILVLLYSYWGIMVSIINFLTNYTDPTQLVIARAFNLLSLCFYVYQILVFTKNETKIYFNAKGKIII